MSFFAVFYFAFVRLRKRLPCKIEAYPVPPIDSKPILYDIRDWKNRNEENFGSINEAKAACKRYYANRPLGKVVGPDTFIGVYNCLKYQLRAFEENENGYITRWRDDLAPKLKLVGCQDNDEIIARYFWVVMWNNACLVVNMPLPQTREALLSYLRSWVAKKKLLNVFIVNLDQLYDEASTL